MHIYFYLSPSNNAWRNMAQDEWLLANLPADTLLFYCYVNAPSVIIGKNQNAWKECDLPAMERDGVRLARRVSGGGAVYHDLGNLNFSFLAAKDVYCLEKQMNVILQAVKKLGIDAQFSGRNDITVEEKKFSGNAFCARGDNRMHHGTLLLHSDLSRLSRYLHVSPQKIQSKGIDSVRARVCNLSEWNPALSRRDAGETMLHLLRESLQETYEELLVPYPFPSSWEQEVSALEEKHASWEWRLGQAPRFSLEWEARFPWGGVEIQLSLREGYIEAVRVYSDALDPELPAAIEKAFRGRRYARESLTGGLSALPEPYGKDLQGLLQSVNL
ncbi:MAG: lipoate--protein ligase [Clostridiales bacterium]|nr:lipoate--protein ligase [Clostridiales bacterium]